ncbi:hypothetical protein ACLKA6_004769 [Drosophila palustris]
MSARKRKSNRGGNEKDLEQGAKRLRMELKRPVRLMDLPLGPLHLIFSKVPLESQKLLRNVSKEMRDEHTDYVLHHYKSFNHMLINNKGSDKVKHCIYKVVEEATNYLLHSGYVSCLLFNLALFFKGVDTVNVDNMQKLLHKCYHEVEWSPSEMISGAAGRILLHRRRLVYMVTLLNLIRHFRSYRKVDSHMNLLHWQLHIELPGAHISANHDRNPGIKEEDKLIDLMSLIAELLVYDLSDTTTGFNRFVDIGDSVYNYGLRSQKSGRGSRLDLKFTILAPLELRNLMEDALAGKVDKSTAVKCPLLDSFSIHLDLRNYGANCISNKRWQICILPLF